jgi:hypothetical protein
LKLQYGLKSLMLASMVTAIVAVIAAPFIQPILDDYELVGVQIVGWNRSVNVFREWND